MTSAHLLRRPVGTRSVRAAAALLVAVLGGAAACRGDEPAAGLPLPPVPEDVQQSEARTVAVEPAPIQPAALEQPRAGSAAAGPLPLAAGAVTDAGGGPSSSLRHPLGDWTVLLAIGGAFAVLGIFRLRTFRQAKTLPPDVFELLGSASLGGPHAVRVVRFGPRTLLLGVSSAGCQTLAELEDPEATERIVSACRGDRLAARPALLRGVATPRGRATGGEAA